MMQDLGVFPIGIPPLVSHEPASTRRCPQATRADRLLLLFIAPLLLISPVTMSAAAKLKLSPALKQLIALPSAKGAALPSPPPAAFKSLFDNIRHKGERGGIGRETWLTLGTAALFTVNSPDAVCQLFNYASEGNDTKGKVDVASVMRETGLKCISFNGIPRSINNLNALHSHLPEEVLQNINEEPQR